MMVVIVSVKNVCDCSISEVSFVGMFMYMVENRNVNCLKLMVVL